MRKERSDQHSLILLLLHIFTSTTIVLIPSWLVVLIAPVLIIVHLLLRGPKATLHVGAFLVSFLTVFIITSSATQLVISGSVDLVLQLDYSLRATSLAMSSSLIVSYIRTVSLLKTLSKVSASFAIALAISLKVLKEYPKLWTDLLQVYRVNFGGNSWAKFKALVSSAKAIASLSVYLSIQITESVICKSSSLTTGSGILGNNSRRKRNFFEFEDMF